MLLSAAPGGPTTPIGHATGPASSGGGGGPAAAAAAAAAAASGGVVADYHGAAGAGYHGAGAAGYHGTGAGAGYYGAPGTGAGAAGYHSAGSAAGYNSGAGAAGYCGAGAGAGTGTGAGTGVGAGAGSHGYQGAGAGAGYHVAADAGAGYYGAAAGADAGTGAGPGAGTGAGTGSHDYLGAGAAGYHGAAGAGYRVAAAAAAAATAATVAFLTRSPHDHELGAAYDGHEFGAADDGQELGAAYDNDAVAHRPAEAPAHRATAQPRPQLQHAGTCRADSCNGTKELRCYLQQHLPLAERVLICGACRRYFVRTATRLLRAPPGGPYNCGYSRYTRFCHLLRDVRMRQPTWSSSDYRKLLRIVPHMQDAYAFTDEKELGEQLHITAGHKSEALLLVLAHRGNNHVHTVAVTSADKVCILAVPRGWYSVRWVLRIQHAAGAHSTTRTVVCRVAGGEATEEWGWVPGQVWRAAMRAFGRVCMLSLKHPSIRAHMVIHLRPRCIAGPRASRRLSIGWTLSPRSPVWCPRSSRTTHGRWRYQQAATSTPRCRTSKYGTPFAYRSSQEVASKCASCELVVLRWLPCYGP